MSRCAQLLFWLQFFISIPALARWETLPPLPAPNSGFACGALAGKIVVVGGTNWKGGKKYWLNDISSFDPTSRKWSASGKLPNSLAYAVAANWNDDLLIAGGIDGLRARNEIWRMTPSLEVSPIARTTNGNALAAGGIIASSLLVVGGCVDVASFDGLREGGLIFHLPKGPASSLAPPDETAFCAAAAVTVGDRLYLFGGATLDAATKTVINLKSAWSFSVSSGKWRRLRNLPITVRCAAAVQLDDNHLLIAGGYGGQPENFLAKMLIYDVERDSYTATTDLPVPAVIGLVRLDDYVYCLGGEDKMKHRTDACHRIRTSELSLATGR